MFAGTGIWGHYYVMCWSDIRNGGAPCTGDPSNWAGAGGTSFGGPIVAGIQALVNQNAGGPQGNPNYVYYSLAANGAPAFHSVTRGDIAVNCGGTENCYGAAGHHLRWVWRSPQPEPEWRPFGFQRLLQSGFWRLRGLELRYRHRHHRRL